mmetsp:Transcript_1908/g.4223  ORF Transcript_1908/g.4223 Transcript_1908/m.4223 type:complete len:274 (-) Transcript_1908:3003-3824(-)
MLETLASHSSIERFLSAYPKHQWRRTIEQVVLIGVKMLEERFKSPPSLDDLKDLASSRHKDRRHSSRKRGESDVMKQEVPHTYVKVKRPSLKATPMREGDTPRFKDFASESRHRGPSQTPLQSSRQLSERKLPKYLENVKSKIKEDVHKDIVSHHKHRDEVIPRKKTPDRYDLPRQLPSEEYKAKKRPPELIEPVTVDMNVAREIFKRQSPKKEGQLLKLAEDFLRDPFMTQLAKRDTLFSGPTSPKYLESWMNSPQGNLLSSLELKGKVQRI